MLDKILKLLRKDDDAPRRQRQREALLDLLVLVKYADHHVARAEETEIRERARGLEWSGAKPVEMVLAAGQRRAREALANPSAEQRYLRDIAERLGDEEARGRAYDACVHLAGVDGERVAAETELLERVRATFEL